MYNTNEILETLWQTIQPATWIINYKDGMTESSKKYEAFYDIPLERRKDIVSMQLKVDDDRFIINTKNNEEISDGFFYHIKEGRKVFMGKYQGANLGFFAERIGFCYNKEGDAKVIRLDHSKILPKIIARMDIITELIDKDADSDEIDKLINEPIKYSMQTDFYDENIVDKKVNIALFGKLEDLEEMGTPPRIYMNNEEIAIAKVENFLQ